MMEATRFKSTSLTKKYSQSSNCPSTVHRRPYKHEYEIVNVEF